MAASLTSFYKNYSKKSPAKEWHWGRTILVAALILAAVLVIICSVVAQNKAAKVYASKNFYFVYAENCNSRSKATECAERVANLGGAGVIYNVGSSLFVVTSVYFADSDAKAVCQQISKTFPTAGVLKVSSAKVAKKTVKIIGQIPACKSYYTGLHRFCYNLQSWTAQLEKGDIDASKLYKNIMLFKQNVAGLAENLNEQDYDFAKAMYSSSLVINNQISSFFSSAFAGSDTAKYAHKLCVSAVVEFIDMCSLL